ncbi:Uncharacterized protein BAE44_0014104 [Dichanthelium oligosanthes]|uniref:Glutaredoxin domain-containing protein n=1 Tax=Dichanthelium oligosanthes TaxID=888268 RepID=A0A1E5VIE6_9POAL|nr:Uncharacterized protein BAE44_0014104 [Dichanthelium oligosanthes]
MGYSSSREARVGVVSPTAAPAEWRQGLSSRSLGMCRGVHAYATLPLSEEAAKDASDPPTAAGEALPAGEGAAAEEDAPGTPAAVMASLEGAASATLSWTAQWSAEPAPSLPPALDLDLAILPGFGQPVEVPSPSHPALLYPNIDMGTPAARDILEVTGFVRTRVGEFHEKMENKKAVVAGEEAPGFIGDDDDVTTPRLLAPPRPRAGKPLVLYFTSLRSVRRTFEDCRAVRAILRCYRVRLDERDVSMHAAFKSELRGLLGGAGFEGVALPRVFIGGLHNLGGAEDVRALHEAGELARALAGCEAAPTAGWPGHVGACVACGEARFVPCGTCHGSCKLFVDDEGCRFAGFFQQCPDCNENGLIRCPVCCY